MTILQSRTIEHAKQHRYNHKKPNTCGDWEMQGQD